MNKIEKEKLTTLYVRLMSESQTIAAFLDGASEKNKELALVARDQLKTNKAFAALLKSAQNNPENACFSLEIDEMLREQSLVSGALEEKAKNARSPQPGED